MLLDFDDRLMERYTPGGRLTRAELLAGAESGWLGPIYAGGGADERSREELPRPERKATA